MNFILKKKKRTIVVGSFYFLELNLKSVKGSNLTFTNIVRIRGKIVQCVIRTAILSTESRSAKRRRLREELKATKRAYRSQPSTPKNIVSNNFLRVLKSFRLFMARCLRYNIEINGNIFNLWVFLGGWISSQLRLGAVYNLCRLGRGEGGSPKDLLLIYYAVLTYKTTRGGGKKLLILRRHSLWTAPKCEYQ